MHAVNLRGDTKCSILEVLQLSGGWSQPSKSRCDAIQWPHWLELASQTVACRKMPYFIFAEVDIARSLGQEFSIRILKSKEACQSLSARDRSGLHIKGSDDGDPLVVW